MQELKSAAKCTFLALNVVRLCIFGAPRKRLAFYGALTTNASDTEYLHRAPQPHPSSDPTPSQLVTFTLTCWPLMFVAARGLQMSHPWPSSEPHCRAT